MNAIAAASGYTNSQVTTAAYVIQIGSVTVSPTSLTFPSTDVGTTSAAQGVTLQNGTSSSVSISSVTASGDFVVTSNGCGTGLAAGASCSIFAAFRPTTTGTRTGTLTISDSGGTQTVSLTGTGAASGVTLLPNSLIFPSTTVGTSSATQTVTLHNGTTSSISVKGAGINGDFHIGSFGCGTTLAAGASCSTTIYFKPTAKGTRTGTFTIGDSAGNQYVSLTGTGQ